MKRKNRILLFDKKENETRENEEGGRIGASRGWDKMEWWSDDLKFRPTRPIQQPLCEQNSKIQKISRISDFVSRNGKHFFTRSQILLLLVLLTVDEATPAARHDEAMATQYVVIDYR